MVERSILEKSKSSRMEAACVMALGIRSSLPKQQKQAMRRAAKQLLNPFGFGTRINSGNIPPNPMVYHHFSRNSFWVSLFSEERTWSPASSNNCKSGDFGHFRGLQLLHHWFEQIAMIAHRIRMIMTMSITTVQRFVTIAIDSYSCYNMLSSWLSLVIISSFLNFNHVCLSSPPVFWRLKSQRPLCPSLFWSLCRRGGDLRPVQRQLARGSADLWRFWVERWHSLWRLGAKKNTIWIHLGVSSSSWGYPNKYGD